MFAAFVPTTNYNAVDHLKLSHSRLFASQFCLHSRGTKMADSNRCQGQCHASENQEYNLDLLVLYSTYTTKNPLEKIYKIGYRFLFKSGGS